MSDIGPPIVVNASVENKYTWKWQLVTFLRQLAVAIITSAVIIVGLAVGFHGQTEQEQKLAEDTLHANLAQACVLALPVTEAGRDPSDVKTCFTQYGLLPPSLVRP